MSSNAKDEEISIFLILIIYILLDNCPSKSMQRVVNERSNPKYTIKLEIFNQTKTIVHGIAVSVSSLCKFIKIQIN